MHFIRLLIHSNIFISIAAVCFMFANAMLFNIPLHKLKYLSVHVFFSTWFVYQFSRKQYHKKMELNNSKDKIYLFQIKHKKFTTYTLYCSFILSVISFFLIKNQTKLMVIVIGSISILYALPLNKIGLSIRLRDVPFIKIFLIALTWSATAILLPGLEVNTLFFLFNEFTWKVFLLQFIYILFITLPFDINDMRIDQRRNTKTIPIYLGLNQTKILIFILCFIYATFFIIIFNNQYSLLIILLCLFLAFISVKYASQISKTNIMLVYDGSMILYFLIVLGYRICLNI
jgi:4-hydroxybenzoate polyprenyltransferase